MGGLLAVEVGNTAVKWLMRSDEGERPGRAPRDGLDMFEREMESAAAEKAIVASVCPPTTDAVLGVLERRAGRVLRYRRDVPAGLEVRVREPERVGDDRLASALGAFVHAQRACVVVDAGTAVTVDAVSGEGEFLGGAILPGPELMMGALSKAELLPEGVSPDGGSYPGRSTEEAMRAGVLLGLAGAVEKLVEEARRVLGAGAKVYATGGGWPVIAPHVGALAEHVPNLALYGLLAALERAEE